MTRLAVSEESYECRTAIRQIPINAKLHLSFVRGNSERIIRYPRMERGTHFADFMRDKRMRPELYHCVIQRKGSKKILSWTQHRSLNQAMQHAEADLAHFTGSVVPGCGTCETRAASGL